MRDVRIQIHPEVEENDLIEVVTHIAQDNLTAAEVVYDSIWSVIVALAKQPSLGTHINPLHGSLKGIRMVPSYLIQLSYLLSPLARR